MNRYEPTPAQMHPGSLGSHHGDHEMDPIDKELRAHDRRAALEAEAGIERLLKDLRDLRATERAGAREPRPNRARAVLGRALIAAGSAIAAAPRDEEPCPDGV